MEIIISKTKEELGEKAAKKGAELINDSIAKSGYANVIVATGNSQLEMLNVLIKENIDWQKVTCFHLDEYIGITVEHPASFRKYLKEKFVNIVKPKVFHYVNGEGNSDNECNRLQDLIANIDINVAFVGIGENGHLAFNDPPANFITDKSYLDVELDDLCRKQQLGEGWFNNIEEVPKRAISMSIHQILKAKNIICSVPDERKANAVKSVIEGEITNMVPSSILKTHQSSYLYLDKNSSSLLKQI